MTKIKRIFKSAMKNKLFLLFLTLIVCSNLNASSFCDYPKNENIQATQYLGGKWYQRIAVQVFSEDGGGGGYVPLHANGNFRIIYFRNDRWKTEGSNIQHYPNGVELQENLVFLEAWQINERSGTESFAGCIKLEDEKIKSSSDLANFKFDDTKYLNNEIQILIDVYGENRSSEGYYEVQKHSIKVNLDFINGSF